MKIKVNENNMYDAYSLDTSVDADPSVDSYWFVFDGYKLMVSKENGAFEVPMMRYENHKERGITKGSYIGTFKDVPCYVGDGSNALLHEGLEFVELRGLHGVLEEDIYTVAGRALQLLTWDRDFQYCSRCGAKVEKIDLQMAKECSDCHLVNYPRISPAVITAIFKEDKILLARNKNFPGEMFSLIAGFVEAGETLEECVEREIIEEVAIKVKNIRYVGSQSWPYPHSMMVGFVADYDEGEIQVDGTEISEAYWFDRDNLPMIPAGVSIARKIIDCYIESGCNE